MDWPRLREDVRDGLAADLGMLWWPSSCSKFDDGSEVMFESAESDLVALRIVQRCPTTHHIIPVTSDFRVASIAQGTAARNHCRCPGSRGAARTVSRADYLVSG